MVRSKDKVKCALVVGASRGIGAAVAKRLGKAGMEVVLAARTRDALEGVARGIRADGGRARVVEVDVRDSEAISSCVRTVAAETEGGVDVLAYVSGVATVGRFEEIPDEQWLDLFKVNTLGAIRFSKALIGHMRNQRWGRIIMVASTAGKHGSLYQSPYNTSKHALVGFVKCAALECAGEGITVNAVCPGFVDTAMVRDKLLTERSQLTGMSKEEVMQQLLKRVPIGRMLESEEVAELVGYLSSDSAGGVTGQAWTIDGGMILH